MIWTCIRFELSRNRSGGVSIGVDVECVQGCRALHRYSRAEEHGKRNREVLEAGDVCHTRCVPLTRV